MEPSNLKQASTCQAILYPFGNQPALQMPVREKKERAESGGGWGESASCHMPAEAKPSESVPPLTWGQSSPSSGVISVSLWTTTLVTDMSGCCSLASLIAWASAYPQEITEGQRQKGGGTCMISSKVETHELDLYTQFTNEIQWLQKESDIVYWIVNSENCLVYMLDWKNSTGKNRANKCFSALLTGYWPSHTHYLVMVDVRIARDDYSLLNSRLWNASFHSLEGRDKCYEFSHLEE